MITPPHRHVRREQKGVQTLEEIDGDLQAYPNHPSRP
jgi:hypothetical protein